MARLYCDYQVPNNLAYGTGTLDVEADWDAVSSTYVRDCLAEGDPRWRTLVPPSIADEVARIYKG